MLKGRKEKEIAFEEVWFDSFPLHFSREYQLVQQLGNMY